MPVSQVTEQAVQSDHIDHCGTVNIFMSNKLYIVYVKKMHTADFPDLHARLDICKIQLV